MVVLKPAVSAWLVTGLFALVSTSSASGVEAAKSDIPSSTAVVVMGETADLSGPWRFAVGDDPRWSQPNFDDRGWRTVNVPGVWQDPADRGLVGLSWWRRSVVLPRDGRDRAWAFTPGEVVSAYEVFANGRLIGRRGSLDGQPWAAMAAAEAFEVPASALNRDGRVLLAVRTYRDPAHRAIHGHVTSFWRGTIQFGTRAVVFAATEAAQYAHLLREMHQVVLAVCFFLMGLYFLLLARSRPNAKDHLWFGLLALVQSIATISNKFIITWIVGVRFEPLMAVYLVGHTVSAALALEFVCAFTFQPPGRWIRGLQWMLVALAVGRATVLSTSDFLVVATVPLALAVVSAATLTVRAAHRGHRDAAVIVVGLVVVALAGVFDIVAGQGGLSKLPVVRDALPLGFAALLFSMALSLSNQFNRLFVELARHDAATSRFVPHGLLRMLGKRSVVDVQLGDSARADTSVLFSDIRSFTTFTEALAPRETFDFLNAYFGAITPAVERNGGFVDKYIGDAMMAVFPGPADDALRAAVEIQRALAEFNAARRSAGHEAVATGIGVHTGSLMAGTVGAPERMDATVVSDTVNLASRVSDATKQFGASLLTTDATVSELAKPADFSVRRLGRVQVKGKTKAVAIYEVFSADPPALAAAKRAATVDFDDALALFEAGYFRQARAAFEALAASCPQDAAVALFVQRCSHSGKLTATDEWDGVMRLTTK